MVATNPQSRLSREGLSQPGEPLLEFLSMPKVLANNVPIAKTAILSGSTLSSGSNRPRNLALLQIPSDRPRTPQMAYTDATYCVELSSVLPIGVVGRSHLLAAVTILLYRYTQQTHIHLDLTLGSPFGEAYRGCFSTDITAGTLAQELINHCLTQLEQSLGKPLQADAALDGEQNPLDGHLPIGITLIETEIATEIETGNIAPNGGDVPSGATQSGADPRPQWMNQWDLPKNLQRDLQIVVEQRGEQAMATLHYNAELFQASTMQRLAGHLQVILAALNPTVHGSIAELPLLTQAETEHLLTNWTSDSILIPDEPLHRHIERHAVERPDAIALRFQEQTLTYGELNRRANQLALDLRQRGVTREVPVAVCITPCLEIAVCLLAIFKVGGVYVPLDPTHPRERLALMLDDTQPQVLLTQSHLIETLPATIVRTVCLDCDAPRIQSLPALDLDLPIDLDQTASIIYTSGTTGKPKGVMASYRNLANYVLLARDRYGVDETFVMPAFARFTFSITMFELLLPLVAGGTLIVLERDHILDFQRLTRTLAQVTMLHTSPSLMRKLLAYIQDQGMDGRTFDAIRHASVGGDMADASLLEQMKTVFTQAEVFVIYGCSEISCMGCTYPVLRDNHPTVSRVGQPFKNVLVRLYDPQQNLVPIGVTGEIYFGGVGVTKGYLHRPELTREKFVLIDGQRFYRTGDLGRWDADGQLTILGRSDFQIKVRGIRIELGDIETALRQAPGVREGIVMARTLGVSDTHRAHTEKSLVAYVVLDGPPDIASIRQFLSHKLPDYMVPAAFVVLEAMPVNLNQKVDRNALPEPTAENIAGLQAIVPPRDNLEAQLVNIWESVLRMKPIGIRNNFFELGGDSLQAVQILTQIEHQLGRRLAITSALDAPTIESLAEVLRRPAADGPESDIVPLKVGGRKPPLFCLYGVLLYRELAQHLDADQPVYGVYLQEEVELLRTGNLDQFNELFSSVPAAAARYLASIRTIQPCGPYYLAGESFGGVIAYEIAQQLRAAGETVALVALLDTRAPNLHAQLSRVQKLKIHAEALLEKGPNYLLFRFQRSMAESRKQWVARTYKIREQVEALLKPGSSLLIPVLTEPAVKVTEPKVASITVVEDLREAARDKASAAYMPQTYDGPILLFRAMEQDRFEAGDRTLGWGSRTPQLQVLDIPGNHLSILKDPNVQGLAAQLQSYLGESSVD
jgi:amino acid adenylation domain-containing protein